MKKRALRMLGLTILMAAMLSGCIIWPFYDDGYYGGGYYGGHRHGHHRHHGY